MPSLGWQEPSSILIIVVNIFGAGKLPDIGGAMGKASRIQEESEEPGALSDGTSTTTAVFDRFGSVLEEREPAQVRADEILEFPVNSGIEHLQPDLYRSGCSF